MLSFIRTAWQNWQFRRLSVRVERLKARIEFERWDAVRTHMEHPQ